MKIGIFDSGKGGTTVMAAIKQKLPTAEYKYIADSANCPYGEKSDQELMQIVRQHTNTLKNWGAKIIVIACNTATTKCINRLRTEYPELKFVGTEPAIKLAADSAAQKVLVMATPGTIHSERTAHLLRENYHPEQQIDLLSCAGLADAIEQDQGIKATPDHILDHAIEQDQGIKATLDRILARTPRDYDAVVLGCTHYSLIKNHLQNYFPEAILIDGNEGVAKRVLAISS